MTTTDATTSPPLRVLVVDDDSLVADALAGFLRQRGYQVDVAFDAASALERVREAERGDGAAYRVVITDLSMPGLPPGMVAATARGSGLGGLELLAALREERVSAIPLAITGYGTVETAVEAVRLGASDVLCKPLVDEELALAVERAVQRQALLSENRSLRRQLEVRKGLESIVGDDPRMVKIFDLVAAVAPTKTTVLMTGESGTGKSLIARAIHRNSPRAEKPYVELSCGSIPETLLESELFGHVKGAFTGAHADKKGRFLAAHGGTLFLDEINSASPSMQLKLLRVLQEKRFEPVGSTETVEVDVRVVLASNQPLEQLVAAGQFRQDLYYRINVVTIELPPLRDRVGDIERLAHHFLVESCREHQRAIAGFTPEALAALKAYRYPGNVRELENAVERAIVLCRRGMIGVEDLPESITQRGDVARPANAPPPPGATPGIPMPMSMASPPATASAVTPGLRLAGSDDEPWTPMTLEEAMREPERRVLLRALHHNGWNRQRTADQLGINRTTLYKKMKALGLEGAERAG
ncbi:MAG: sigma-54-dependent Fis family transcriptional regulator [Phycisphaerae bacterium]|nr:sigma-54-dependent Fis family transcriptional regulator [Phycisphaerae bacterium]